MERIGDIFQQATKYLSPVAGGKPPQQEKKGTIALPPVDWNIPAPLFNAVRRRRSIREYSERPLSLKEFSLLCAAALGVTTRMDFGPLFAIPSAGAMNPLELHVISHRVDGLPASVGRYRPGEHALEVVARGDFRRAVVEACLGQELAGSAGAVFAWTAVVERSRRRYGQRCYRYIYLEAGHSAQNLLLAATALNLGACAIGAFFDDQAARLLGVDGVEETVLYLASVGTQD